MSSLVERYAPRIVGQLCCLDRVVITGTLPGACYAQGMTGILYRRGIRIFDYAAAFAKPLAEQVKANAQRLAAQAGIQIEYVKKLNSFRKEDRVRQVLAARGGNHPGLVHAFSALEPCASYQPWHDKRTAKTYLKSDRGKCLHYYFYFIDPLLGLCYLRVPTYCPFRLQFYFNGHNWLKAQLDERGIGCELIDNVIVACEDWAAAQKLVDGLEVKALRGLLDRYAKLYCPAAQSFESDYHWSLMQAEYAHDIVFKTRQDLAPLYESITRTAICAVKVDQVASFLSRKLSGNYQGEAGGSFSTRVQGTCIKHHMGRAAAIKMYDKLARVLRIETTVNDVSFFKHHRKVEHQDGTSSYKLADLPKSIYSLPVLIELMAASNRRYLAFISELPDDGPGLRAVQKLAEPTRDRDQDRAVRGFNLLQREDHELFCAIARGEFAISGMTNRRLREVLKHKSGPQLSRLLRGLRVHGLIKKVGRSYKYYLTELGRRVTAGALKLRELLIVPALAQPC